MICDTGDGSVEDGRLKNLSANVAKNSITAPIPGDMTIKKGVHCHFILPTPALR